MNLERQGFMNVSGWHDVEPLLNLSNDELGPRDIAETNLKCAIGLPGSEDIDISRCLAKLDEWASLVKQTTAQYLPRFHRAPAEFWNSEAKFRILCMVTVLQRDLGVRYDPEYMEGPYNATDSHTNFIHGPLTGTGGTCVNLPVLYIAIGRRLGYPLKLVQAKEHLFVRWTGNDGERFNIEATSVGFEPRENSHYHFHPRPLSEAELAAGEFLRDMTPRQELAEFLLERGQVFRDNLLMPQALQAYKAAAELEARYRGDWAIASIIGLIHRNLHGPIPECDFELYADLVRVTPPAKEAWQRWATPRAHDNLMRIFRLLVAKARTKKIFPTVH